MMDITKQNKEKQELIYLSVEEFKKIVETELDTKRLNQVKDVFLFACLTGLNYVDIKKLTRKNIVNENDRFWLKTKHHKTDLDIEVPLDVIAANILKKYHLLRPNILPIISHQKANAYLKEIAEICEISKSLTFTTAHNTFVLLMLSCGYPRHVVSKMLGHVQSKSMCKYLNVFQDAII